MTRGGRERRGEVRRGGGTSRVVGHAPVVVIPIMVDVPVSRGAVVVPDGLVIAVMTATTDSMAMVNCPLAAATDTKVSRTATRAAKAERQGRSHRAVAVFSPALTARSRYTRITQSDMAGADVATATHHSDQQVRDHGQDSSSRVPEAGASGSRPGIIEAVHGANKATITDAHTAASMHTKGADTSDTAENTARRNHNASANRSIVHQTDEGSRVLQTNRSNTPRCRRTRHHSEASAMHAT